MEEKKLSKSKASEKSFSVKSEPLPKEIEEKLHEAYIQANDNVKRNDTIYQTSNSHSNLYPTK